MPSAIRQSGPRQALRHLAPTGNAPASRGLPTTAQRVGEQTGLEVWPGEEGVRTTRLCPGLVRSLGSPCCPVLVL